MGTTFLNLSASCVFNKKSYKILLEYQLFIAAIDIVLNVIYANKLNQM